MQLSKSRAPVCVAYGSCQAAEARAWHRLLQHPAASLLCEAASQSGSSRQLCEQNAMPFLRSEKELTVIYRE